MSGKLGPGWAEAAAKAAVKGDTNHDQILRATGKRPFSNWERARSKKKGSDAGHLSRKLDKALGKLEED